jgi:hypothetical protein
MSKDLALPSPERFGLSSFAELLPAREPIIGEAPGSFADFRDGMMRALVPFTPYECVIAENLIAIEWELLQHRRMRLASLRKNIQAVVCAAVIKREQERYDDAIDVLWDKFIAAGGDKDKWKDPYPFDEAAARKLADELATRVTSPDPDVQTKAQDEMLALGLEPLQLMSDAYLASNSAASKHDNRVQQLEGRRRDVKRDYDALQKTRPVDGEIIDG